LQLAQAQETIRAQQEELTESNRGLVALTLELEQRVDERTAALRESKDIEVGVERTRKELEVLKKSSDESLEYAESIINTVREPLIIQDQDLRVVTASRSFYEVFKVNHEETVGQLIYDLSNKQRDIPNRLMLTNLICV
jgi:PAS domain-containing protein